MDPQEIAAVGAVFPTYPWEVGEVAVQTLLDQETANNEVDAGSTARPWLDLTKGDSIPFLAADLATLKAANWRPPGIGASWDITTAEATARWAALDTWYTARGHFWPSNGPFYLETVDIANRQTVMKAFREYLWPPEYWDDLTVVATPTVSFAPTPLVVFAGTAANFDYTVTVGGDPTDDLALNIYMLRNVDTGAFITKDVPTRLATGSYRVELTASQTSELLFGTFEVISVVTHNKAAVPAITPVSFLVRSPTADWFEAVLDARAKLIEDELDELSTNLGTAQGDVSSLTDAMAGLTALLTAVAVLAVVAIAVAVVGVILVLRRTPPRGGG